MTKLEKRLVRLIEETGPLTVEQFMHLVLCDPRDGYYTTKSPFGRSGDFVTSPDISQLFGELIGIWTFDIWRKMGSPDDFCLIEAGPGTGTMILDILRTLSRLSPSMMQALELCLIEVSPALITTQKSRLVEFDCPISWHTSFDTIAQKKAILVANEFLDALPLRQYQFQHKKWNERLVGLNLQGTLSWGLMPTVFVPACPVSPREGDVFEHNVAAHAFMLQIAKHLHTHGGAALFIDYGHFESRFGDTLQAVKDHRFIDVLAEPGNADLTAHIDFSPLVQLATSCNLTVKRTYQGDFLINMGLLERAGRLGATLSRNQQISIENAVERLAGAEKMGHLFKVMAISEGVVPHGFG